MPSCRTTSSNRKILPRPGDSVKAKIRAAGLSQRVLARRCRLSPSTLSDYLAGRLRNRVRQIDIWLSFKELTGRRTRLRSFWGDLLGREALGAGSPHVILSHPSSRLDRVRRMIKTMRMALSVINGRIKC